MGGINPVGQPICVIDNDTTVSRNCPSYDYYSMVFLQVAM